MSNYPEQESGLGLDGFANLCLDAKRNIPKERAWVVERKQEILELHSSKERIGVFTRECSSCERFYKPCMFSISERKGMDPTCRWCNLAVEQVFQINAHIFCNKSGEKICGGIAEDEYLRIRAGKEKEPSPPKRKVRKELSLKDVALPLEQEYKVTEKKMSQKQRKAAERAAKQAQQAGAVAF